MPERVRAALSLGGNIGQVAQRFHDALATLDAHENARVLARSGVWRTPPWGKTDQPDFLNMAAIVETSLSARALLDLCLSIERTAGRERNDRWGPRTLDIDIVTFGDAVIAHDDMVIPHPRAHERAFVLVPLAEIGAGIALGGSSVGALAALCDKTGMTFDAAATRTAHGV